MSDAHLDLLFPVGAGMRLRAVQAAAEHVAVDQEPGRHARVDRTRGAAQPGAPPPLPLSFLHRCLLVELERK